MLKCTKEISDSGIEILHPEIGYRFSTDSVVLGRVVNQFLLKTKRERLSVLDVGAGVGALSAYSLFNRDIQSITAIEINKNFCDLCGVNLSKNFTAAICNVICANIVDLVDFKQIFDLIITNPPFYKIGEGRVSRTKDIANHESVSLSEWIKFCIKRLKPNGVFFIIHLSERLQDILSAFDATVGGIEIFPIDTGSTNAIKRVVVKCQKSSRSKLILHKPIIL